MPLIYLGTIGMGVAASQLPANRVSVAVPTGSDSWYDDLSDGVGTDGGLQPIQPGVGFLALAAPLAALAVGYNEATKEKRRRGAVQRKLAKLPPGATSSPSAPMPESSDPFMDDDLEESAGFQPVQPGVGFVQVLAPVLSVAAPLAMTAVERRITREERHRAAIQEKLAQQQAALAQKQAAVEARAQAKLDKRDERIATSAAHQIQKSMDKSGFSAKYATPPTPAPAPAPAPTVVTGFSRGLQMVGAISAEESQRGISLVDSDGHHVIIPR